LSEQKAKKDEYQKALVAFGLAMKDFHKDALDKAPSSLRLSSRSSPRRRS
jgi:hypothetical protein